MERTNKLFGTLYEGGGVEIVDPHRENQWEERQGAVENNFPPENLPGLEWTKKRDDWHSMVTYVTRHGIKWEKLLIKNKIH